MLARAIPSGSSFDEVNEKNNRMEELRNIFAASCVEAVARKLGCSTGEMYRRMKEVNLFRDFIYPCYGTLHTQSRQIVTEDVIAALKIRQERLTAL